MPKELALPDGSVIYDIPDNISDDEARAEGKRKLGKKYGTSWFVGGQPTKKETDEKGNVTGYSVFDKSSPSNLLFRATPDYSTPDIEEVLAKHNLNGVDLVKHRKENKLLYDTLESTKSDPMLGALSGGLSKAADLAHYANYKPGMRPEERFAAQVPDLLKASMSGPAIATGEGIIGNLKNAGVPAPLAIAGGVAGGTAAYLGARQGIDRTANLIRDEQHTDTLGEAAQDAIINAAGAKFIGLMRSGGAKALAAWHEYSDPGSVVGKKIASLGATYSQVQEALSGKNQWLAGKIEDIFANKTKQETVAQAAEKVPEMVRADAARISGKRTSTMMNPRYLEEGVQGKMLAQAQSLNDFSEQAANVARNYADQSQLQIPGTDKIVSGPIELKTSLQRLGDYVKKYEDTTLVPKEEDTLYKQARSIIADTNAKFDPKTNQLISSDPVSFDEAWRYKKSIGNIFNGKESAINPDSSAASFFNKGNFNAMNEDISNGFNHPAWGQNGGAAKETWEHSKQAVETRWDLFGKDKMAGKIVNSDMDPGQVINELFSNSRKMNDALRTSSIKLPDGSIASSPNMRRELLGLKLQEWVNSGVDKNGKGGASFNFQNAFNQLEAPENKEAVSALMNGETKANTLKMLKGLSNTEESMRLAAISQQPMNNSGQTYYRLIKPTTIGLSLAPSLVTGALGVHQMQGLAASGFILSGVALAHVMATPQGGRVMAAIANGQKVGSDYFMSHAIVNALRGTNAVIYTSDSSGKNYPMKVNKDSNLVPVN